MQPLGRERRRPGSPRSPRACGSAPSTARSRPSAGRPWPDSRAEASEAISPARPGAASPLSRANASALQIASSGTPAAPDTSKAMWTSWPWSTSRQPCRPSTDVVVGMRESTRIRLGNREADAPQRPDGRVAGPGPGVASPGPARDRVLEIVEPGEVGLVGRGVHPEQVLEPCLVVVVVGQLEDGLPRSLGQPEDRPAGHPVVPGEALLGERTQQPRGPAPGESAGRGLVEDEDGVVVLLEEGRGDLGGDLALDGGPDDLGLVLAPGHEDDPAGGEDRPTPIVSANCGVCSSPRSRRRRPSGSADPGRRAGSGPPGAARLVEPDVAGPADAEDLEVDAAGLPDASSYAVQDGRPAALGTDPSGSVDLAGGMSMWSNRCSCMKRW